MSDRAAALVLRLGLKPHPEGGHYREIFRSGRRVRRDDEERDAVTSIYFLLQRGEWSRWHVVDSDEIWHFYDGESLELVTHDPDTGRTERRVLGIESSDASAVLAVPAGVWQAARPLGAYCLAGCTVGPGFDFSDFRFVRDLPEHGAAFAGPLAAFARLL